jgi:hypothetical protein
MKKAKDRKYRREKGRKFEKEVEKILCSSGIPAKRTPLSGIQDGFKGDITIEDPDSFPFFLECKYHEGWKFEKLMLGSDSRLTDWFSKARLQSGYLVPGIVFTRNYGGIWISTFQDVLTIWPLPFCETFLDEEKGLRLVVTPFELFCSKWRELLIQKRDWRSEDHFVRERGMEGWKFDTLVEAVGFAQTHEQWKRVEKLLPSGYIVK